MIYPKFEEKNKLIDKVFDFSNPSYPSKPREIRQQLRKDWNEAMGNLKQEFLEELADEYGIKDYPKKKEVLEYVWMKGHSSGYREVEGELMDLVDILILK
jgi:hypothetical protein